MELYSETPVQFSQNLVESLQSSSEVRFLAQPKAHFRRWPARRHKGPGTNSSFFRVYQTDSSRAQTIELHIQNRVAEELRRIQARETQTLADLEQRFSTAATDDKQQSSISLDAPRVPLVGSEGGSSQQKGDADSSRRDLNSQQVAQEIEALREKLAARRKVKEVDEGVEKAREDVVKCLRGHEKRPLDCWAEVDTFKKEVARLEREWVKKVVG